MKKLLAFVAAAAIAVFSGIPMTASATSVGDVIAYAYQVGMPEDMIQQYIAMGSGREWTSEQCDQAIAALSAWAAERDTAISGGGQQSVPAEKVPDPIEPEEFEEMSIEEKQEYITSIPSEQKQEYLDVIFCANALRWLFSILNLIFMM